MSVDLKNDLAAVNRPSSIIMVMGVGGAGGNAVAHMWNLGIEGVHFMVCNTDRQALDKSPVEIKVQLGDGHGAGNDPEKGRDLATKSLEEVRSKLEEMGVRMLFITAGMGGGTGTGASPVIAKLAHEMGLLTVAIVTTPDPVEGSKRYNQAFRGLEELREHVDSLLVINNEHIAEMYGKLSLRQAFGKADDILASAAKGIAEIITVKSDLVNVDFADVDRVMRGSGNAHMGVASASGEDRAEQATLAALASPLLSHRTISGAENILVNISVADTDDLSMEEQRAILSILQDEASRECDDNYEDANIIWGTSVKSTLGDKLEVVVVATGFDEPIEPSTIRSSKLRANRKSKRKEEAVQSQSPLAPKSELVVDNRSDTVVLGKPDESIYDNIDEITSRPAYERRGTVFISMVEDVTDGREVLKVDDSKAEEPQSGDLFNQ